MPKEKSLNVLHEESGERLRRRVRELEALVDQKTAALDRAWEIVTVCKDRIAELEYAAAAADYDANAPAVMTPSPNEER